MGFFKIFAVGVAVSGVLIGNANLEEGVSSQTVVQAAVNSKFKAGDIIRISPQAASETNGYNLVPHRHWYGQIKSITPKKHSRSNFEYHIQYDNGQQNVHVPEQDLVAVTKITVTSRVNKVGYYGMAQNVRKDGLYTEPYGTGLKSLSTGNGNAKNFNGLVVKSDQEVRLSNGQRWLHVFVGNKWQWIHDLGLQGGPLLGRSSLNQQGQIKYSYLGNKYGSQVDEAAKRWNAKLGRTVFVKSNQSSQVNVAIYDHYEKANFVADAWVLTGVIRLNAYHMDNPRRVWDANVDTIDHEFGHTLGLAHFAWTHDKDVMWYQARNDGSQVLTNADASGVKQVLDNKIAWYGPTPLISQNNLSTSDEDYIED